MDLLKSAQQAAQALVEKDPDLAQAPQAALAAYLRKHFSKSWFLATIA